MYMTGIAAIVSTLVMSPVAADATPLSCIPAGVTRAAGFRLDLNTGTYADGYGINDRREVVGIF
jgi:hypothetical protein